MNAINLKEENLLMVELILDAGAVINSGATYTVYLYNNVLVRRRTASHLFKLISILTKGSLTPHGLARLMLLELQR